MRRAGSSPVNVSGPASTMDWMKASSCRCSRMICRTSGSLYLKSVSEAVDLRDSMTSCVAKSQNCLCSAITRGVGRGRRCDRENSSALSTTPDDDAKERVEAPLLRRKQESFAHKHPCAGFPTSDKETQVVVRCVDSLPSRRPI